MSAKRDPPVLPEPSKTTTTSTGRYSQKSGTTLPLGVGATVEGVGATTDEEEEASGR